MSTKNTNNNGHYSWLKCKVDEGMFPEEFSVEAKTLEGMLLSMFVDKRFVERDKGIKVEVLEKEKDYFVVYLPAYPLEKASRVVKVSPSEVIY